jgi:hypothetical protein
MGSILPKLRERRKGCGSSHLSECGIGLLKFSESIHGEIKARGTERII